MIRIREIPDDRIYLPVGRTKVSVAVELRSKDHLKEILFNLHRKGFEVKGTS